MKAQITLTVSESKRLIAKAVKEHPLVNEALEKGVVAIGLGSTNACIVEEILGKEIEKERYVAGLVDKLGTCVVPSKQRLKAVVLEKGEVIEETLDSVVRRMKNTDVFIKGANALDMDGIAGVMMASLTGGTIAQVLGVIKARGVKLLIPVGLEKLVPHSIEEVSKIAGIYEMDYSAGVPVGVMPMSGEVLTEIEAFELLAGVSVYVIGSGSIGGQSGVITMILDGEDAEVKKAVQIVEEIKGEKVIASLRGKCNNCYYRYCPQNTRGGK